MRCVRLHRKLATNASTSQQECEGAKSIQTSIHQTRRAGTSTSLFPKSHDHVGERHENNLKVVCPGSPLFASTAWLTFGCQTICEDEEWREQIATTESPHCPDQVMRIRNSSFDILLANDLREQPANPGTVARTLSDSRNVCDRRCLSRLFRWRQVRSIPDTLLTTLV